MYLTIRFLPIDNGCLFIWRFVQMESKRRDLTSLEIRSLMLEVLAYEADDIGSDGKTFKQYGYQGTQSDLYRLLEGLAIKKTLINEIVTLSGSAWAAHGYSLIPSSTTNFSKNEIKKIYEQFHLLIRQGVLAPGGAGSGYGDYLPYFHVTDHGLKCLEERDLLPYDIDGYLDKIRAIPSISEWSEFYIQQALQCYNADCMEASIIMLGLANENIIIESSDTLLKYLDFNDLEEYGSMKKELDASRTASERFSFYKKFFNKIKGKISDSEFKAMLPLNDNSAFESYSNFTRITRNQLSHPSETQMERIEVLMIFISFIKYCETQYGFIDYFKDNSNARDEDTK